LAKNAIDSPRLCAEVLVGHALKCERLKLYMDADRPASPEELAQLRELVGRALRHEPIQYVTGEAWFYGMPLHADPRALIPRPSTETLVEEALREARRLSGESTPNDATTPAPTPAEPPAADPDATPVAKRPIRPIPKHKAAALVIAEVCTGSGCIAVALLKQLPRARVVATDISTDALALAGANALRHNVADRLELIAGDLLVPLAERVPGIATEGLDLLLANPPYIPDDEWPAVERNVKDFEPTIALRGGPDGLDFVRPLLTHGPTLLKPGGAILLEVAAVTAHAVAGAAETHGLLEAVRIVKDLDGLDRIVVARRRASA
jgi:release factor glutamine methyltransferase